MDINYLREMYANLLKIETHNAPVIMADDCITVFTENVQVKFPKSKKRRIRKKWAKNPFNFQYARVDNAVRIGNTFYVSRKVFDALKTQITKPTFASGGILNNQAEEYIVPRPLIEPILFMQSTGGMAGLNLSHEVVEYRNPLIFDALYPKDISNMSLITHKFPIMPITDIV